jgi:hypothetical protein
VIKVEKAVKRTAGVFLAGAAVAVSLAISTPVANACYDNYNCGQQMVWHDGPVGRPAVLVEAWKWDWCWVWNGRDYDLVEPQRNNYNPGYYQGGPVYGYNNGPGFDLTLAPGYFNLGIGA